MKTDFEATLRAAETMAGLSICIRDLGGHFLVDGKPLLTDERRLHATPFCLNVKRTGAAACVRSDNERLYPLCRKKRDIFVHTCHAGVHEIVAPVFDYDRLLAVVFIGQFRYPKEKQHSVPVLTRSRRADIMAVARLLRAYVAATIRQIEHHRGATRRARDHRIRHFVAANLRDDPSVGDLARHLGLSTSRTSHLVKEHTGLSFRELKHAEGLARARELLVNTDRKVASVALASGFHDPGYFHRWFKKHTGLTPAAFRQAFGQPEQI